jgi:hypothetical protein
MIASSSAVRTLAGRCSKPGSSAARRAIPEIESNATALNPAAPFKSQWRLAPRVRIFFPMTFMTEYF